jgi:hypothetical protein
MTTQNSPFTRRINLDLDREPVASDFGLEGEFIHLDNHGCEFETMAEAVFAVRDFADGLGHDRFITDAVLVRWTGYQWTAFTVAIKTGYSPS